MSSLMLYLIVVLSWGSSWLAIKFQIGEGPPTISVAYRFFLAGAILALIGFLRKENFHFTLRQHGKVAAQAAFLFCLNYIFIYFSEQYLVSGVVSVVFSTLAFMNIFNARIFLGQPIQAKSVVATIIGFAGVLLVFKNELSRLNEMTGLLFGLGTGLLSAYLASLGNIMSIHNHKEKLPLIPATALGMIYGAAMTLLVALGIGEKPIFPMTAGYISSLLYLSVVASIVAFLAYLTLLNQLGAAKAGYATFVFPLVAIALSVMFENYILSPSNMAGIALILVGNYLIMSKHSFSRGPKPAVARPEAPKAAPKLELGVSN